MVLDIVLGALSFIITIVCYVLAIKMKVKSEAENAINNAENLQSVGKGKMVYAISQVRKIVPPVLKPFFTDTRIERMLQTVFDTMEEYAKKQIEKKGGKTE